MMKIIELVLDLMESASYKKTFVVLVLVISVLLILKFGLFGMFTSKN